MEDNPGDVLLARRLLSSVTTVEALCEGANDYFVKERLDAQLLTLAILRSVKPAEVGHG